MKPFLSGSGYVQEARALRNQYSETLSELDKLSQENKQTAAALTSRANESLTELVAAILPELSAAAIARAVQLTGYLPLQQNDPLVAMDKMRETLTASMANIEQDRRYRDRLLLRAPRIGMLTREIAELEEFHAPLAEIIEGAAHPRMERLLQVGYGTSSYDVPFWRMSYYQDWKAGDEILAKLPKFKTFAALREDYLAAQRDIGVYNNKLGQLRREVALGEAIEREYAEKQKQLSELPMTCLQRLRDQLCSYIRDLDLVAIGDRLAQDPALEMLAKRYLGLQKQTEYLQQSSKHLLENSRAPVQQTIAQLDREIQKYSRPKNAGAKLPSERIAQLRLRNTKYQQQATRYQQSRHVIVEFDDYDHGCIDDDYLWWDLITESYRHRHGQHYGHMHGSYIDEVSDFRSRHPDHHFQRPDDWHDADDAAAASAGTGTDDSRDVLTSHDVS